MTKCIDCVLAATVFFAYWLFVINPVYVWCLNQYYPVDLSEYASEPVEQTTCVTQWRTLTADEWLAADTAVDIQFMLAR